MISRVLILFLILNVFEATATSFPARVVKGLLITEAVIDGKKVNVILDSGAPGFVLNENYYASDNASIIPCTGVNGPFACKTYMLDTWEWLGLHEGKTKALLTDLSYLERAAAQPIHAIIGLNVLADYYVSIDFDQQQVSVRKEIPSELESAFTRFYYADHLPVIACKVNGQKKLLALDTGSAANYLFHFDVKSNGVRTEDLQPVKVVGTGNIESLKYRIDLTVEIPEGELPADASFIIDPRPDNAFKPDAFDGIIGQEFLSQYNIIIHPGKQKIMLIPRQQDGLVME